MGAAGGLQVAEVAGGIFFFQAHVHHVVFFVHVVPQGAAALGGGFVHLELLDGVVRQIFEHDAVVSLIEILAVEQEVVELAAVDKDFAIAVEGGAGQLADEVAEHGTFGQVEGIGVVNEGIALVVEFDFGGRHYGFAQLLLLAVLVIALQAESLVGRIKDASFQRGGNPKVERLVARAFDMNAVAGRFAGHVEFVHCAESEFRPCVGLDKFRNDGAV